MSRAASRLALALTLVLWMGSPLAIAQEEEAAPAPRTAIPVPEVSAEAERLAAVLAEAQAQAAPDPVIMAVASDLEAFESAVEEAVAGLEERLGSEDASLAGLADLEAAWSDRQKSLTPARDGVAKRVADLEEARADLEKRTDRWQVTLDQSAEAPKVVAETARRSLQAIERADQLLVERLGSVIGLQQRASAAFAQTERAIESVHLARSSIRTGLLMQDSPPLWAIGSQGEFAADSEMAMQAAAETTGAFADYLRSELQGPRLLLLLLIAGGIVAYLRARVLVRKATGSADLDDVQLLLQRPVSTALLAALGMAALVLTPPSRPVIEVAGLLFLAPALRVLTVCVPTYAKNGLFALGGFWLFDRVRGFMASLPDLERSLLLLEFLAALYLLSWLIRPARFSKAAERPISHPILTRLLTRLAIILLAVASLANLLGYVGLSRLVGEGVLNSAYTGVFIVGVLEVVRVLLAQGLLSEPVRQLRMARFQSATVEKTLGRFFGFLSAAVWVHVSLGLFAIQDTVYEGLADLLTRTFELGALEIRLGDILLLVVSLWLAFLVSRLLRFVLSHEVFPRVSLQRGVPNAFSTMLHYALVLLGLAVGFSAVGIDFDRIAIVLGALGVGIGFGLQSVVNNFVSGLILLFERPIQVGDTVQMTTTHGDVRRIGIRSSTIRTWEGAEIIVPNADLISLQVTNWTLSDRRRRIDIDIGVAYGTDAERVREILLAVAAADTNVLSFPESQALFLGFGDSSLDFQLRIWVGDPDQWMLARSAINVAIQQALAEAGISVPFPQRDVHMIPVETSPPSAVASPSEGSMSDPAAETAPPSVAGQPSEGN